MNERIDKLVEQAYDELVEETGNIVVFDEDFQQRFAKLIVRECAKAAGDFEYARLHDSLVEDHVLKHFGVEE